MTRIEIATRDVAAMLRLLAMVVRLCEGQLWRESILAEASSEVMRALDRLADHLPAGEARDEAARQCWAVAPAPPDASMLLGWADRWEGSL